MGATDKPIVTENRSRDSEIIARARISEVYAAATGLKPKPSGKSTYRCVAAWRAGANGLNVSLDDDRGVYHDFVDDTGGGTLDMITRIRGGGRQDALRWL